MVRLRGWVEAGDARLFKRQTQVSTRMNMKIGLRAAARMTDVFLRLMREDSGQDLVEYALFGCLVVLAAVVSMKSLGTRVTTVLSNVGSSLTSAI
jgi:pilus assembly protein Flp/PilA